MASYQYIYVMKGLNKTFPGGKQVLKDIWLSLPARRQDRRAGPQRRRQVDPAQGHGRRGRQLHRRGLGGRGREGRLPQAGARSSTRRRTCWATSWRAPARWPTMLTRFEEVSNAFSDPDADMDKLIAEQAELQEKIDAGNGWDLGRPVEIAMDALRCPPSEAAGRHAVGRREAPRRALPPAAQQARHAAARRADQPSRRRIGGLAGAPSRRVPRHRRGGHPRSLLPRQRRRLDPRARPRRRHPVGGQLLVLAEAEGQAPRARREDRRRPPPHHAARARMDGHQPVGAALQEQGAHRRLQPDGRGGAERRRSTGADRHPGRPAARRPRHPGREASPRASAIGC